MTIARRYFLALSLANLCYAPVWKRLLDLGTPAEFTIKNLPGRGEYAAAICGVLLWAAALTAIDTALRRGPHFLRAVELVGGLALLVLPAQSLLAGSPVRASLLHFVHTPLLLVFGIAGVAGVALSIAFRRQFLQSVSVALFACLAFCAVTFATGLYRMTGPKALHDGPLAARLPNSGVRPRVLWLIFDEWDQRLTFDARPVGLELPAIDRLRAESLHAERAMPASDATLLSMTSLIEGRAVRTAEPIDAGTLLLKYRDGGAQRFGDEPNLFSEARRSGMNAAVFGWDLPYCRVLAKYVVDCWWQEMDAVWNASGATFASALLTQPRTLIETSIFSPFGQSLTTLKHRRTYEELLARGNSIACDADVQLALVHFDVPHPPYFYDRASRQPTRGNSLSAYPDALALVDKTISELRTSMERAGTWGSTTVLFSSDHFYRASALVKGVRDQRVPFILHLAGETAGVSYEREFQTVLTHDLILAVLRAEIGDAGAARRWLDAHAVT